MKLAIFGKESLDELEEMAVELFTEIQNKNVDVPKWSDSIYLEDQKAIKLFIVPVKDSRNLTISFQIPDLDEYFRCGVSYTKTLYNIPKLLIDWVIICQSISNW